MNDPAGDSQTKPIDSPCAMAKAACDSGWIGRLRGQRCIYLFVALLLLLVLTPLLGESPAARVLGNVLNVIVLASAVTAISRSTASLALAIVLALPVVGYQVTALFFKIPQYLVYSWGFAAGFYFMTLVCLLRYVLGVTAMDADKLNGAAAAYLLAGIFWAYIYAVVQHLMPGSFASAGAPVPVTLPGLIEFSFAVLTTSGYGDVTPALAFARGLVTLEKICGVLFVAILIARLAGIYPSGR